MIETWGNLACRENAQVAQCVLLVPIRSKLSKSSFCHIQVREPF